MITTTTHTVSAIQSVLIASIENSSEYQDDEDFQSSVVKNSSGEGGWREEGFAQWFAKVAKVALTSPQQATMSAQRGLEKMHDSFLYTRARDGVSMKLDEACEKSFEAGRRFGKVSIKGKVAIRPRPSTFLEEVKALYARGLCEASVVHSFETLETHPEWLDLSGREFVVLGAFAPLAPTRELLRLGATVYAVDGSVPDAAWKELMEFAESSASGTLWVMTRGSSGHNADIVEDMAEIADFICHEVDSKQPIIVNVLVEAALAAGSAWGVERPLFAAAAGDAITEFVCFRKPDSILVFITSPGEMYLIPEEAAGAVAASGRRYNKAVEEEEEETLLSSAGVFHVSELAMSASKAPMGSAIRARRFGRNDDGVRTYLLRDCLVRRDGPECALARLVGRWRAVLARALGTHRWLCDSRRHVVSCNVSPPFSRTPASSSDTAFQGVVPMRADFASTLLAHLAVRDLKDVESPANPTLFLDNPLCHFLSGGLHGGVWRSPASYDAIAAMMTMTASL